MPIVATEPKRLSDLVKKEFWISEGWCRKVITVNDTAGRTYAFGDALGTITASGKSQYAIETAVDGSEDPVAIFIGKDFDTIGQDLEVAVTTDTEVLAMVRGPLVVGDQALNLDATYDNQTKIDAAYASLDSVHISVETQV